MKKIYVHGLGQTPDSWAKTIAHIKNGEQSVCLDLPEIIQGKKVIYQNLYAAFSDACNKYDEPVRLCQNPCLNKPDFVKKNFYSYVRQ